MAAMATEFVTNGQDDSIYRQLEDYPWDLDKEFQGGLSAILGPTPSPSQIHDLTLRAQCFYFARKKAVPISFDGYKAYLLAKKDIEVHKPSNGSSSHRDTQDLNVFSGDTSPQPPPSAMLFKEDNEIPVQRTAPYPPTFAEIVELITSGAPIPGIKEIPDTVLYGQSSKSIAPKRKKPWETELPAGNQRLFGDDRDRYIEQELPNA